MPKDLENHSGQPNLNRPNSAKPIEIEPLLTAFYNENQEEANRSEQLWQRLEPQLKEPQARPVRVGLWFSNFLQKRNNKMRKETPLLDRDETDFQVEKPRRSRVGSLFGALAALVLVLGLVVIFAVTAGKGPNGNPDMGGQPVATNTVKPEPSLTPPPFDSRTPVTVNPNASPTPLPYSNKPTQPVSPGPTPTFNPNASPTPVPYNGKPPVTTISNSPGTATPVPGYTSANPGNNAALNLYGVENVAVAGLVNVPVAFDYKTMPENLLATNPEVHFYASKDNLGTILNNLDKALQTAGYEVTPPLNLTSYPEKFPPGGIYLSAKKAGQPDLYLNLVSIVNAGGVKNLSRTAYFGGGIDFENTVNPFQAKGYPYLLLVIRGNNLIQAMADGSDHGAGSPNSTPTPVK